MGKAKRKPRPQPPRWYWADCDNCWDCNHPNNCNQCKRLKQQRAYEREKRERKTMKNIKKSIMILAIVMALWFSLTGCEQGMTKSFGGDMTIELEPGLKLETIDWEDDSLWYLTRPMRENEEPETYVLNQSSEFGVFEGTVTIIESRE